MIAIIVLVITIFVATEAIIVPNAKCSDYNPVPTKDFDLTQYVSVEKWYIQVHYDDSHQTNSICGYIQNVPVNSTVMHLNEHNFYSDKSTFVVDSDAALTDNPAIFDLTYDNNGTINAKMYTLQFSPQQTISWSCGNNPEGEGVVLDFWAMTTARNVSIDIGTVNNLLSSLGLPAGDGNVLVEDQSACSDEAFN